jgi:predicted deacylase
MFKTLCDKHPTVASYESVGKDSGGVTMWLFKIGNSNGGRVLWDGAIHGNEDFGSETIYLLAKWLLESGDSASKTILSHNYVLLMPIIDSRWDRSNWDTSISKYGVNLNRNFATGWSKQPINSAEQYSGPNSVSEAETKLMRATWAKYKPKYYTSLHQGATLRAYYDGALASKCTQAISLMRSKASGMGISPWSIVSMGSGGLSIGDAAKIYGAASFEIEVSSSWEHTTTTWNTLVNSIVPKAKILLIAQCQLCTI